ncbi:MAG: hypothetical protein KBC56_04860 [Flavobacterium sp.]|nr:hypothetical protein [Flavobacterium sp.]
MQTTIFDTAIFQTANDLLDLLNDGRKPKERFEPQYTFKEGDYTILIASTKDKEIVLNIIDAVGNIPKDFSVNWRTLPHILQDLKIKQFTNK